MSLHSLPKRSMSLQTEVGQGADHQQLAQLAEGLQTGAGQKAGHSFTHGIRLKGSELAGLTEALHATADGGRTEEAGHSLAFTGCTLCFQAVRVYVCQDKHMLHDTLFVLKG
eukprot:scaffold113109_cov22-Tisochrysis_lutea.AAC.1